MKNLNEIKKDYLAKKEVIDFFEQKIEQKKKQIERLEKRKDKARIFWADELIKPILTSLSKEFPNLVWDALHSKELNTFGLRRECPVFAYYDKYVPFQEKGHEDNKLAAGITFTPGNLSKGELCYDTHEKSERIYPVNSIGAMNNFDRITAPVENIEQLVKFIKKQLAEKEVA